MQEFLNNLKSDLNFPADRINALGVHFYKGIPFSNGNIVPQNKQMAKQLFILSSSRGFLKAFRNAGGCYEEEKNFVEAFKYYQQAKQKGHEQAQGDIDRLYESSEINSIQLNSIGVMHVNKNSMAEDYQKARIWFKKAIDKNDSQEDVAFAFRNLGFLYERGLGFPTNHLVAAKCYLRAKIKGHPTVTNDMYRLALTSKQWNELGENYYSNQNNKIENYAIAFLCYKQAIQLDPDNENAQYSLGYLYQNGQGTIQNPDLAIKHYEQAVKLGNIEAKKRMQFIEDKIFKTTKEWYKLGENYYLGINGKTVDYVAAKRCFDKVIQINNNHSAALFAIGTLYEFGKQGFVIDLTQARNYYEKIHDTNFKRESLKRVERKLFEIAKNNNQSLELRDNRGRTALHRAAQYNCLKLYASLKEFGAIDTLDSKQKYASSYIESQSKVENLRDLTRTYHNNTLLSAAEIITSRISLRNASIDTQENINILNNLYGIAEIKPLLDLAKLAMLGRHKLSLRPAVIKDNYDSDDEEEPQDKQKLRIEIDPHKKTIEDIICFGQNGKDGKNAHGVYFGKNKLYVAGGQGAANTRGTLIHELCHFITKEVFNNNCLPYSKNDQQNQSIFNNICIDMKSRRNSIHSKFQIVFNFYEDGAHHAELIVRVAQIIVSQPDGLNWLQTNEPHLMNYYNNVFLQKVRDHIIELEKKAAGYGWSPNIFKTASILNYHIQRDSPNSNFPNSNNMVMDH